ncbi:MAG: hypothetical protein NTX57_05820 [Armatimonadetes bacterium]|nr:hypothetical protein [Armatimonadota bacterium]
MSDSEFVTLQAAADTLGLSVRQVSRLVSRLASDDVRRSPGRPTTCRLEALRVLRHGAGHVRPSEAPADEKPKTPTKDTLQSDAGHVSGHDAGQEESVVGHESELVAELRADRDSWKAQAEKALQLVDQAQRLQLAAQHRVAELEGKLLPATEQINPAGLADDSHGSPGVAGGTIPLPESSEEPKRGFWARLWGKG